MKFNFVITMFLLVTGMVANGEKGRQHFDRSAFYAAMTSENLDVVNVQLETVSKSTINNKEAFEGALLMRKAGLVSNFGNKYSLFKSGRKKLESAITKESNNAEFSFLRLMIQENAPGILGYNNQIDQDNKLILSAFKSLPPAVQKAITDYSKKSKVLKPGLS